MTTDTKTIIDAYLGEFKQAQRQTIKLLFDILELVDETEDITVAEIIDNLSEDDLISDFVLSAICDLAQYKMISISDEQITDTTSCNSVNGTNRPLFDGFVHYETSPTKGEYEHEVTQRILFRYRIAEQILHAAAGNTSRALHDQILATARQGDDNPVEQTYDALAAANMIRLGTSDDIGDRFTLVPPSARTLQDTPA